MFQKFFCSHRFRATRPIIVTIPLFLKKKEPHILSIFESCFLHTHSIYFFWQRNSKICTCFFSLFRAGLACAACSRSPARAPPPSRRTAPTCRTPRSQPRTRHRPPSRTRSTSAQTVGTREGQFHTDFSEKKVSSPPPLLQRYFETTNDLTHVEFKLFQNCFLELFSNC